MQSNLDVTSGMQRDRACIRAYIFRSTAYAFLVGVFFVKQCLVEKTESLVHYSFSCVLDTKFCLRAAGGIYVYDSLTHSGGEIAISGSLTGLDGGAVLKISSWVFGRILRWL